MIKVSFGAFHIAENILAWKYYEEATGEKSGKALNRLQNQASEGLDVVFLSAIAFAFVRSGMKLNKKPFDYTLEDFQEKATMQDIITIIEKCFGSFEEKKSQPEKQKLMKVASA